MLPGNGLVSEIKQTELATGLSAFASTRVYLRNSLMLLLVTCISAMAAVADTADTDGDSVINIYDLDDDNDGILDINEGSTLFTITLDEVSALPASAYISGGGVIPNGSDGLRLSDASGNYTLDLYNGPSTSASVPYTFNTVTGRIQSDSANVLGGGAGVGEVVEIVYTTLNSPISFSLSNLQIQDLDSLSVSTVRDAYVWSEPGTWTPIGTPAAAVVSVDTNTATHMGTIVLDDPDGSNDLAILSQFTQVTAIDNTLSDVLVNLSGIIENHEVEFDFESAQQQASLYLFNAGTEDMLWGFFPQLDVTLQNLVGVDTDGDTIPDHQDLDSDNDGISDLVEGNPSVTHISADLDSSGSIALAEAAAANAGVADADLDGVMDIFDSNPTLATWADTIGNVPQDVDADLLGAPVDLDSDGDGIPDTIEARPTAGYVLNDGDVSNDDADGDGVVAIFDLNDATSGDFGGAYLYFNNPVNSDADSVPDYLDDNSDDDAESDLQEGEVQASGGAALTTAPSYADPDGSINNPLDNSDGSDLLKNDDGDVSEVDYRSVYTAPIATSDSTAVAADTTAVVSLSDNVSGGQGGVDISTIDLDPSVTGIQNSLSTSDGQWNVNVTGVVTFDPLLAFQGIATIAYTVSDNAGNVSSAADISVTVAGAVPVATDDSASVSADTNAVIDLSDNISDVNSDIDLSTIDLDASAAGVQSTVTTADGEWSVNATGVLTFNPVPSFQGIATVGYTVQDGQGNLSNLAEISVVVAGSAPFADADSETTLQDTDITIDVLNGDTDANGNIDPSTLDLDPATPGQQTSLALAGQGNISVSANQVVFSPLTSFTGTAVFTYTVSDTDGNTSNVANVSIAVNMQPDTDGDGITDNIDLDDDNDGIPDSIEGNIDTDNDGIIDSLDRDSDNDGITDTIEAGGTDSDGNGVIDGFIDGDLDGLDDATSLVPLTTPDTDNDGLPDFRDLDADNDGITDLVEAGGDDIDGNGMLDGFTDADGNGIDDNLTAVVLIDTDGDGHPDYLDLDSDNDGITDATEAGGIDLDGNGIADTFSDANSDGLDDDHNNLPPPDTDGDGRPDYQDLDSDNDGITDTTEAGGIDRNGDGIVDELTDADNNGLADVSPLPVHDTDGDGIADFRQLDSDSDGIPDRVEAGVNAAVPADTDEDGIADYRQLDSDSDSIPDAVEAGSNGNLPTDTDDDGIPDYRELDSDTDGIPDRVEAGSNGTTPADSDADGTPDYREQDSDNDGIPDTVEAGPEPDDPADTDSDGTPDFQELDADNDGVSDDLEAGADPANPMDTDGDGIADFQQPDSDQDGDGLADSIEGVIDTDNDGTPDYLDKDSDNDGIADSIEAEFDGDIPSDKDGDGVFDYIDVDADNDGISDAIEGAQDTDSDGVRNFRDLDVDNDGILDIIEARPGMARVSQLDADLDGVIDPVYVFGPNGMANTVETVPESGLENYILSNVDKDSVHDYRDLDADNDGLLDTLESDHTDKNLDGIIDSAVDDSVAGVRAIAVVSPDTGLAAGAGGVPRNTDNDGLADFRDGDSDNDGLTDATESFGVLADANGDGRLDEFNDTDGDGYDDASLGAPLTPADTDNDGFFDAVEIDADADGITDVIEAGGTDTDNDGKVDGFFDGDANGIDDGIQTIPLATVDTDNDNTPDFQDLDSDNDGLSDIQESGGTDANGDGIADALALSSSLPDENGDGIPDFQQLTGGIGALLPAPDEDFIITGAQGSGCSLTSSARGIDPLLPVLFLVSVLWVMRCRHKGIVLVLPMLFIDAGNVNAAQLNLDDNFKRTFYSGIGLGFSRLEPITSRVEGWDTNDPVNNGGQINVGVDLLKQLSLEFHTADLGSAGLSPTGRINYHVGGISALVYAGGNRHNYKRRGLTAYARGGYGFLHNSPVGEVPFKKLNANHLLVGAGVEYSHRSGFGARMEVISFDKDVQYGQFGLIYRFGKKPQPPVIVQKPVKPKIAAAKKPAPRLTPPVIVRPNPCVQAQDLASTVHFNSDSAKLTAIAGDILDSVAQTLLSCPDFPIEISAHTDNRGSEKYNFVLSQRRAWSVINYLRDTGVSLIRLRPRPYGETRPVDTNDTPEGRRKNRRADMYAQ